MEKVTENIFAEFKGDKNPRLKILKLGQKITDRIGHKVTSDDPEYWGLAPIVTDEMADIALKMKVRKPYTLSQLMKITKKDNEYLTNILQEMSMVGLLEYNWENETKEKQWVLPIFVPGVAEYTNMRKDLMDKHPELAKFFERMAFLPLEKITALVPEGGAGIGMHVIPVEKAIPMDSKSLPIEHISHWLDKYEGKYSVGLCSCRYGMAKMNEGCGDDPEDWCIGVGDMADYCVQTNKGRYATKEEVLKILKKAEDNGFVHQITNIDGEDKIFAICNCNVNVCYALRTSQLFNTPNMSRSAYTAKVDKNKCVACGSCVEHCPAGAVKLGQKLCTLNGEIKYPKHELPNKLSWGKDKWDINYRDNNRINTYDTGTSPCKSACPAHIAVQGYLKLASQGKYKEALALIKKENPLPAVCGRICNKRCEDACTRGLIDQAVSIDEVKKFIAQQDLNTKNRYIPEPIIPSNLGRFKQKIAIIGSGPAGLSCAFYLANNGYNPTIFEKDSKPGGMLTYGIPSFKLEKDVIQAEIDIIKQVGVDFKFNTEVGKDITIEELKKEGYKAFYVAIGCQEGKLPNIKNESIKNTFTAVDFLHNIANHNKLELNGKVVVIGGGNVAIDAARTAARLKAKSVDVYCLEQEDEMPASKEEIFEAKEDGVIFNFGYGPKEIKGKDKVEGIIFKKCFKTYDKDGKFNPVYDENVLTNIDADCVIFSIGQKIKYGELFNNTKVQFNKYGYPLADKITFQTNDNDIFVGGDVLSGPKFVIDAIAQGKEAATSIHRYVQLNSSLTIGRDKRYFVPIDKNNLVIDEYDKSSRQEVLIKHNIEHKDLFKETKGILTEEQIQIETRRCLSCGASIVDENKCIGCGICTTKCEFDAIHLIRDHPNASKMVKSEDKLKVILPYALKRAIKIKFSKKTKEEKESQRRHKEYKKSLKKNA